MSIKQRIQKIEQRLPDKKRGVHVIFNKDGQTLEDAYQGYLETHEVKPNDLVVQIDFLGGNCDTKNNE